MLQSQCCFGPFHPEMLERQSSLKTQLDIAVHPNSGHSRPTPPAVAQAHLIEIAGKMEVGLSLGIPTNLQPTGFQLGVAATCRRGFHLVEMMEVELTTHLLKYGLAGTGLGMS